MEFKEYLKNNITTDEMMTIWQAKYLPLETEDKVLDDYDISEYVRSFGMSTVYHMLMQSSFEDYQDEYGDDKKLYFEHNGLIELVSNDELENIMYEDEDKIIYFIIENYDSIEEFLDNDYKSLYDRDSFLERIKGDR